MKDWRYHQYEVSSYVRDGLKEHRSVHNQGYWLGRDYIGVGPGAHGRVKSLDGHMHRTYRVGFSLYILSLADDKDTRAERVDAILSRKRTRIDSIKTPGKGGVCKGGFSTDVLRY